ncbi:MAG: FMN adenylyltransferase [Candidatus Methanoperedens nitroreducens]|uniref:FAD synthase n=1 Tax=Candidatus Methanoperedens nitratireducens TaxID=1392998 RepID=A0A0P8CNK6_9EURY|nr:adenylyltransferase/cytidyltransferase family protein [Candidatus Methanoperedens sp. BLZ2]KAB2944863.1 MAG: FAD synthase [Candidatus Methanoperedens sp.]KPQ45321.1 MAG: FMN adenylyltransferase [Candidatus Methanoperedens sp. BLZ1]MBZ0173736.1 FAD synthase [Candidatus Methanoperedens nitroreducens]CAG0984718.1 FAD synthetase [Methanosarcinales archaeon]MCX9078237.1 FAD synthase [Candidatus Methanoperedens sp.]
MVRVLATGTFDLLHPGHLLYLSKARALGDELFVIVARDSMIKHKPKPIVPEKQRLTMVQALRMVDAAMLGSETDMFLPIREIKPDIIALGKNQFFNEKELEAKLVARGIEAKVMRVQAFEQGELCSSAAIIRKVLERNGKSN